MNQQRTLTEAHVQCPECGQTIEVSIPVITDLENREDGQHLLTWVDQDGVDVQPVWDHALTEHGPQLEETPA